MKIFHNVENKKIDFLDERFYSRDGVKFVPSVTTVLEVYPKGYGYIEWLKSLGYNSEEVVKKAAEKGSRIHDAIDRYLNGEELKWSQEGEKTNYSFDEWMMILRFVEFWTTYKPVIIANEQDLIDEELGFGGTLDLVCKIQGIGKNVDGIWLIDYKSGNAIYKSYEFQISAYEEMWNKVCLPEHKITKRGALHLNAATRGADKSGRNIQGKGWKLHEFDRSHDEAYKIFDYTHRIWLEENPDAKPKNLVYPDSVKLIKEVVEVKK